MKIRNMVRKYAAPVLVAGSVVASTAASAVGALDAATVTTVKESVLADAGTASGAGFAVMAVVLSLSIGFGLLQTFVRKGAQG
ncbi:hypothetical protein JHD42_21910 [Aeromonas veronii]|uniref:hypothetical protein n=1 Tax=Aeromonas veronii TaxID=654 RepID=UPI0018F26F1A|nr:hypothetical protein [Aeromonas veronii]MBJ7583691.1 hypothetical protein [Aeromonas veronii]